MSVSPTEPDVVTISQAVENLANYAIDRDDMKAILDSLPQEADIDPVAVEYEIQLLKILSVGWALSYFLEESPLKEKLTQSYWIHIQEFANNLSQLSATTMDKAFDYFAIIKDRLDSYLTCLNGDPAVTDPTAAIGPRFAQHCQSEDNVFTIMVGSKMFSLSVNATRSYLDSIQLNDENPVEGCD